MAQNKAQNKTVRPGLARRMGAIFYDALLLCGILFLATALALPLNGGHAFRSDQVFYFIYLLTVSFLFFAWFWTHGGQTLGMRAWHIKVSNHSGNAVSWLQSLVRFIAAILSWATFGLGFVWIVFDTSNNSWHDIASQTQLVWDNE